MGSWGESESAQKVAGIPELNDQPFVGWFIFDISLERCRNVFRHGRGVMIVI